MKLFTDDAACRPPIARAWPTAGSARPDRPTLALQSGEAAEGFSHQALLEGGEDGLDDEGLEEPRGLPVPQGTLAEGRWRAHLAGDGHEDQIGPLGVVAGAADDDGGPLLALLKIGERERERERHPDDIAEVIGGHTRHRPRCPRPGRTPVLRLVQQP
jgi:hypothetical protein